MKKFLVVQLMGLCLYLNASANDSTVYVFPNLKFLLNKSNWADIPYSYLETVLRSYVEIKSNDGSNRRISVFTTPFYNDEDRRKNVIEYERNKQFELKNGRVSYLAGFLFSTRWSSYYKGDTTFYCNGFYLDSTCRILVGGSSLPKDSALLKEDVASIIMSAKIISPAQIDKELGLPVPKKRMDSLMNIQNKYVDDLTYPLIKSNLEAYKAAMTRETVIKDIKNAHSVYEGSMASWGALPPLEELTIDSIIHIYHRYYGYTSHKGYEKLKLVTGIFPPTFTVTKYFQHVKDLYNGNFTLDELLYQEMGNPITIDHTFYPLVRGQLSSSYIADAYQKRIVAMISPHFPGEEIKRVEFGKTKEGLTCFVEFKKSNDDDKGYVYFTKQNGKWTARAVGRPVFDRALYTSGDQVMSNNFLLRPLYNNQKDSGGLFYQSIFVKTETDPQWTAVKLNVQVPGKYNIVYQYTGNELKRRVANKRLFQKTNPYGEYFSSLENTIMDVSMGDGESADAAIERANRRTLDIKNFASAAAPSQRIHICEYDFYDINKDGVKDMISFAVSEGKLVDLQIATIVNKKIKMLPKAPYLEAIRKNPTYQFLIAESLKEKHVVE